MKKSISTLVLLPIIAIFALSSCNRGENNYREANLDIPGLHFAGKDTTISQAVDMAVTKEKTFTNCEGKKVKYQDIVSQKDAITCNYTAEGDSVTPDRLLGLIQSTNAGKKLYVLNESEVGVTNPSAGSDSVGGGNYLRNPDQTSNDDSFGQGIWNFIKKVFWILLLILFILAALAAVVLLGGYLWGIAKKAHHAMNEPAVTQNNQQNANTGAAAGTNQSTAANGGGGGNTSGAGFNNQGNANSSSFLDPRGNIKERKIIVTIDEKY